MYKCKNIEKDIINFLRNISIRTNLTNSTINNYKYNLNDFKKWLINNNITAFSDETIKCYIVY